MLSTDQPPKPKLKNYYLPSPKHVKFRLVWVKNATETDATAQGRPPIQGLTWIRRAKTAFNPKLLIAVFILQLTLQNLILPTWYPISYRSTNQAHNCLTTVIEGTGVLSL